MIGAWNMRSNIFRMQLKDGSFCGCFGLLVLEDGSKNCWPIKQQEFTMVLSMVELIVWSWFEFRWSSASGFEVVGIRVVGRERKVTMGFKVPSRADGVNGGKYASDSEITLRVSSLRRKIWSTVVSIMVFGTFYLSSKNRDKVDCAAPKVNVYLVFTLRITEVYKLGDT